MFTMKIPTTTMLILAIILVIQTECKLLTSKKCEVYDPDCTPNNCPRYMDCPTTPYRISHCFAVMSDTPKGEKVIRKGCWLQNLLLCPLNNQCKTSKISRHSLRFCCCTGDNCNSKIH